MDVKSALYFGVTHFYDNFNLNLMHVNIYEEKVCDSVCYKENLQSKNIIKQNSLLLRFLV